MRKIIAKMSAFFFLSGLFVAAAAGIISAQQPGAAPAALPKEVLEGMVRLDGGTFIMGCSMGDAECQPDETPPHPVTLKGFRLDVMEVTQEQYQQAAGAAPSAKRSCPKCPVDSVTWEEARAYCAKLGKRLPTEAEWEYAARAGTAESRYGKPEDVAWFAQKYDQKTQPVGTKQPNAWGLYDMLGNVWEWTADWYDAKYYSNPAASADPAGPATGFFRVTRGGGWLGAASTLRVSNRSNIDPKNKTYEIGFRCAKD